MDPICNIEIIKDGVFFVARTQLANGKTKEFRHQNFEDVLTEMVVELQDELSE
jgi:hypothetical protein